MRRVWMSGAVLAVGLGAATTVTTQAQPPLGFFITSAGPGDGANLGGLAGPTPTAYCFAAR